MADTPAPPYIKIPTIVIKILAGLIAAEYGCIAGNLAIMLLKNQIATPAPVRAGQIQLGMTPMI
jgi:hypothetical protein